MALVIAPALVQAQVNRPGKNGGAFDRGLQLFTKVWEPALPEDEVVARDKLAGGKARRDRDTPPRGDGLGPLFNERSCLACHFQGGVGGAGSLSENIELLTAVIPPEPLSALQLPARLLPLHPGFVSNTSIVLHHFSTSPKNYAVFRETLLGVNPRVGLDAAKREIAVRKLRRKLGDEPVKTVQKGDVALRLSERNTPPLFGLGLIDSISREEIAEVAQKQQSENPNIHGRMVGRFGWRGQIDGLEDFVRSACATELGLQVSTHHQALDPIEARPDRPDRLDLSDRECEDLTAFVAGLPAPRRVEPSDRAAAVMVRNGENLFQSVGCAVCHRPKLGKVKGIYSDLLVHEMGSRLSDPAPAPMLAPLTLISGGYSGVGPELIPPTPQSVVRTQEWKTPPLWGLADSGPYLHDGRAATIEEAIAFHGGEAAQSADRYLALPAAERSRVLAFLNSLAAPDPAKLPQVAGKVELPSIANAATKQQKGWAKNRQHAN